MQISFRFVSLIDTLVTSQDNIKHQEKHVICYLFFIIGQNYTNGPYGWQKTTLQVLLRIFILYSLKSHAIGTSD